MKSVEFAVVQKLVLGWFSVLGFVAFAGCVLGRFRKV
jgi:hypothetical protein